MRTIKKVASHIFIDGFGGMTQGLFATLIIGTMIQQIGLLIGGSTGNVIYLLGKAAAALTSAGIGVGVAVKYGESPLVTVSAAVAAMVGGYAGKITGGTFFVDGNAVLAGPAASAPSHSPTTAVRKQRSLANRGILHNEWLLPSRSPR